jgi:hypothetical protein
MQGEQAKYESNMKSCLMKRIPVSFRLLLVAAVCLTMVSAIRAADAKIPPPAGFPPLASPGIDPATGLPVATPAEDWKDPDWKDPEKVIKQLRYDGLPLGEVANNLRNAFDVLVPHAWQNPNDPSAPMDLQSMPMNIQLRNVTASEIFNAMNLVFETENSPVRWALKMNGTRPTAVLRVVPALLPASAAAPLPPVKPERIVVFVGDLLRNEKPAGGGLGGGSNGGMTIGQLFKTVSEVYRMSYGETKDPIQYHEGAQLLVITGTPDQVSLVQQTLTALRDKVQLERGFQAKTAELKAKTEEPKPR